MIVGLGKKVCVGEVASPQDGEHWRFFIAMGFLLQWEAFFWCTSKQGLSLVMSSHHDHISHGFSQILGRFIL